MTEVIDPSLIQSFLPERDLSARAEIVANHTGFHAEVTDENVARLVERALEQTGTEANDAELRAFILLQILSRHCLEALMHDEKGRSEHQIAGEICRIANVAINWAHLDHISELISVPEFAHRPLVDYRDPAQLWVPSGTIFPCPSIDGYPVERERYIASRTGEFMLASSMHVFWVVGILEHGLPEQENLRRLVPPILLHTDKLVADETPRFYVYRRPRKNQVTVEPRVLVGV
jgi:hypothetical protein